MVLAGILAILERRPGGAGTLHVPALDIGQDQGVAIALRDPRREVGQRRRDVLPQARTEGRLKSLQADLELIPGLLMDELINNTGISDKGQYIRLVQALLINLSDVLPESEMHEQLCNEAETVLQFMQNFLYQHFDFDFKVSVFYSKHFQDSISLKLEYWKIKLSLEFSLVFAGASSRSLSFLSTEQFCFFLFFQEKQKFNSL